MIGISFLCGFLGALSGAEKSSKFWRRFLIPILLTGILIINSHNLNFLYLLLLSLPLSLGYGQPDTTDAGSKISRILTKFISNSRKVEILNRLIIALLFCLVLIIKPLINGHWLMYLLGCLSIIFINVFIGGDAIFKDEGTFLFCHKVCLWEEFIIYFNLAFITLMI